MPFACLPFLQKRDQIQFLIGTCLSLAEKSDRDSGDILNDALAQAVTITKQVTSPHLNPDPFGIPEVPTSLLMMMILQYPISLYL